MTKLPINGNLGIDTKAEYMRPGAWIFSVLVGLLVLPLFASQALLDVIAAEFNTTFSSASLVTVFTLAGYAAGLFFLVPLADIRDGRQLAMATTGTGALVQACVWLIHDMAGMSILAFACGLTTSAVQILVSIAAGLTPEERRGRAIGTIMSGLMLGILLSRPFAALIAQFWGWRYVYLATGAIFAAVTLLLWLTVPPRPPMYRRAYPDLMRSMWAIFRSERVLQSRALSQALCMGAFGAFWTTVAYRLQAAPFFLTRAEFAVFCIAGTAGIVISPVAGRLADGGFSRPALRAAHLAIACGIVLAWISPLLAFALHAAFGRGIALALLALSAFIIDCGTIGDQAIGRRAVNLLRPDARSRINGLYTGIFFLGNALGSRMAGILYQSFGWAGTCVLALFFAAAAFLCTHMTCRLIADKSKA